MLNSKEFVRELQLRHESAWMNPNVGSAETALAALPPLPRAALFGFVEMTNGVNALPATRTGFVLCAAIMNWGGLSVQAQTRAMLAGSTLSARRCVIGKAVQALAGVPLALLAAQRLF